MEGFKKVDTEETKKILQALHSRRSWVQFKLEGEPVVKCRTEEKGWGLHILAVRPATLSRSGHGEAVTGNFILDGNFYFFRATLRIDLRRVNLDLIDNIQWLIRRKNRRFDVPPTWDGSLVTRRVGDRVEAMTGRVLDLSLSGGRVGFNKATTELKAGDIIQGHIRLKQKTPLIVEAVVRHQRSLKTGLYSQIVGLEFTKVFDPDRYQKWILELQQALFT